MTKDPLQELLEDTDRDAILGAAPVVAYDPQQDGPEFLSAISDAASTRARLTRRGRDHGHIAVLNDEAAERVDIDLALKRWRSARPVVLRGAFAEAIPSAEAGVELYEQMKAAPDLNAWSSAHELPCGLSPVNEGLSYEDPERDLAKMGFSDPEDNLGAAWMKLAKLSTHPEDESLRLRLGFGREGLDDASPQLERQRVVSQLGRTLLPGMEEICANKRVNTFISKALRGTALLTQPLAYWNRPEGGALFHHDAFGENSPAGQRGVLYVQTHGETLWLALSIDDLVSRVAEMTDAMILGDLQEIREKLFPEDGLQPLLVILDDEELLREELGKPGCGKLAALVNHGPSFTAWLADSGHACMLGPGDGILLPNHGVHHTCMHSVFCMSDHTTYAISMAIRLDEEPPTGSR
ncbi:MAG: hypothetical protein OSB14_06740 [Planctomycetota bacterium]|nr:hypothetical protein [Planctomycetota bacterium]